MRLDQSCLLVIMEAESILVPTLVGQWRLSMLAPTVVELKEPALVQQVTQLATSQRRQPEDLVAVAVRDYLEGLEEMAIHKETEAFWQQHEELVTLYTGQYVAMRQGVVIDHDSDVSYLEKRVRDRFGLLPVLIAPVTPALRSDIRWRGGRVESVRLAS